MILDNRMPVFSCEDRKRMVDNTEPLMARGDSQMDRGSTYHRRIKKKPWSKCVVPTEDVHRYFSNIWNGIPNCILKELFIPAGEDSRWYTSDDHIHCGPFQGSRGSPSDSSHVDVLTNSSSLQEGQRRGNEELASHHCY
jgi:hypothetical protein